MDSDPDLAGSAGDVSQTGANASAESRSPPTKSRFGIGMFRAGVTHPRVATRARGILPWGRTGRCDHPASHPPQIPQRVDRIVARFRRSAGNLGDSSSSAIARLLRRSNGVVITVSPPRPTVYVGALLARAICL